MYMYTVTHELCTHTHTDPEGDNVACRMLRDNAQNLMLAVSEVLYATDSAIIEVPSCARNVLCLQWVKRF